MNNQCAQNITIKILLNQQNGSNNEKKGVLLSALLKLTHTSFFDITWQQVKEFPSQEINLIRYNVIQWMTFGL